MRVANPAITVEQEIQILRLLRQHGSLTRRQLSLHSGYSVSLVRQLTQDLVENGLIAGDRIAADAPGRPSQLWGLAPDACLAVGLDVGGNNTRLVILDSTGHILHQNTTATVQANSGTALLEHLRDVVLKELASLGDRQQYIRGLGVAFSGFIDRQGHSIAAPNIDSAQQLPLKEYLQASLNLPVTVDDSSRTMALAEMRYGAGQHDDDFICVNVGAGIGMGIIINRQLYRGSMALAGEIGHIPMQPNGDRCHCGSRGCLETLASGRAIAVRARYLLEQGAPSILRDKSGDTGDVTAKTVTAAAREGDRLALDLLNSAGMWLGMALATAINLFSPQKIVLTGGVMRGNQVLFNSIREAAERYALPQLPRPLPLVLTELDDQVGALGAATLILDQEFEQGFAWRLSTQ